MKLNKTILLIAAAIGMTTLMSTTCSKSDTEPNPGACSGYVSATSSGNISGSYCFDALTSFTYEPNGHVSLWARESSTDIGFDFNLNSDNGTDLVPGTYNCGPGELGFVELIIESNSDNEFYKSQSGTLTFTRIDQNGVEGSFNVNAVGYYNNESINFKGTFSK